MVTNKFEEHPQKLEYIKCSNSSFLKLHLASVCADDKVSKIGLYRLRTIRPHPVQGRHLLFSFQLRNEVCLWTVVTSHILESKTS